jgi:ADP-heptose:LPS heptosyltransferase
VGSTSQKAISPSNLAALTQSIPGHVLETVLQAANEAALAHDLGGVLALDAEPFSEDIASMIEACPLGINLSGKITTLRGFGALVQGARCLIAYEGSGLHFAAAFGTPALAIFGYVSPESRLQYYPSVRAIWHPENCRFSPCFSIDTVLPKATKCPRGPKQEWCECCEGISVDEIFNHLAKLLNA